MNKEFEISELADVREVDVVVQQVIVNNEIQNITNKTWAIVCPECGRVIYQFPIGTKDIDAHRTRNEGEKELLKIATHCPTCGTKLHYSGGDTIDNQ